MIGTFAPLPPGSRVKLLADGGLATIAGWDHPGMIPRAETVRYALDRDDGISTVAHHAELAPTASAALRLVAINGQRAKAADHEHDAEEHDYR